MGIWDGVQFKMNRLADTNGSYGTEDQVLTCNADLQIEWADASGGGGGIGGSISNTQVAFGSTTAGEITGSARVTFVEGSNVSTFKVGDSSGELQSQVKVEQTNVSNSRARVTLSKNNNDIGYLEIAGNSTDFNVVATNRLVLESDSSDIILTPSSGNAVAINLSSADTGSALHVGGRTVSDNGVQVGTEASTTAVEALAGTLRYRTLIGASGGFSYSYIEMCMQTDNTVWSWVTIEVNRWTQS